jgi:diguanylate cyclase (GGDEF)-like protein
VEQSRRLHSRQVELLTTAVVLLVVATLGGFGWWAALRIDDRAVARQTEAVERGLSELSRRIVVEQESSTIWDDAVLRVRAGDGKWIADNLVEWVSAYFGHDLVYLLDPSDRPIRAVANGVRIGESAYDRNRATLDPLVSRLRYEMAARSADLSDSTEAIQDVGVVERVALGDQVGIATVRPILPSSNLVRQAPGEEYVHISVRLLDAGVTAQIGEKYSLDQLRFEIHPVPLENRPTSAVKTDSGKIVGYFSWQAYRPALQLIQETGPAAGAVALIAGALVWLLVRRVRRTSSQLEVSEQRVKYLAFHDAMTRIPNRALFEDRLDRALANARHSGAPLALHLVDLDGFKQVNDTLGHQAGDELIRQAAGRLSGLVEDVDTVARLGGDEFAVIQVELRSVEAALALSARIVAAMARPFEIAGQEILISASVGLAVEDAGASTPDDIFRHADLALYEAKTSGRGRYQLFAGELDIAIRERRALEQDLRAALNGGPGLGLVYQPIFDAGQSSIVGAEALVRWNHPSRGLLSPPAFIGLAEERNLIDQLGLWVLRQACSYAKDSPLPWVAVNVSPLQFRDELFADRVFAILQETGLAPDRLELEITEGLLLQNSQSVQHTLHRIRAAGVRVALDDFGTGYSSISYLRTYGIDKLKIDKSYVDMLGIDLQIDHIVRAIIDLARAMHMKVTAEGMETEAQREILRQMGCDQLQGYLLSRPLSPEALEALLQADQPSGRDRRSLLAG